MQSVNLMHSWSKGQEVLTSANTDKIGRSGVCCFLRDEVLVFFIVCLGK